MTPEERQRRIREVAERLAERLAEHWPEEGADINDLEDFAAPGTLWVEVATCSGRLMRERSKRNAGARKETRPPILVGA